MLREFYGGAGTSTRQASRPRVIRLSHRTPHVTSLQTSWDAYVGAVILVSSRSNK